MLHTELLPDGRTHTWSDRFKIVQEDTGNVYDDAIDTVPNTYTESDIPKESATGGYTEADLAVMTNAELEQILAGYGLSASANKSNMIRLILYMQGGGADA